MKTKYNHACLMAFEVVGCSRQINKCSKKAIIEAMKKKVAEFESNTDEMRANVESFDVHIENE